MNFEIFNKSGDDKFDIKVRYKVGKFLNSSEVEVLDVFNELVVLIII